MEHERQMLQRLYFYQDAVHGKSPFERQIKHRRDQPGKQTVARTPSFVFSMVQDAWCRLRMIRTR